MSKPALEPVNAKAAKLIADRDPDRDSWPAYIVEGGEVLYVTAFYGDEHGTYVPEHGSMHNSYVYRTADEADAALREQLRDRANQLDAELGAVREQIAALGGEQA